MKIFTLTTILIINIVAFAKASDYQTVYSNKISFFVDPNKNIRCIKTDSFKILSDTVYYLFSNIQRSNNGCFSLNGYSWIGKKVILNNNYNIILMVITILYSLKLIQK